MGDCRLVSSSSNRPTARCSCCEWWSAPHGRSGWQVGGGFYKCDVRVKKKNKQKQNNGFVVYTEPDKKGFGGSERDAFTSHYTESTALAVVWTLLT